MATRVFFIRAPFQAIALEFSNDVVEFLPDLGGFGLETLLLGLGIAKLIVDGSPIISAGDMHGNQRRGNHRNGQGKRSDSIFHNHVSYIDIPAGADSVSRKEFPKSPKPTCPAPAAWRRRRHS